MILKHLQINQDKITKCKIQLNNFKNRVAKNEETFHIFESTAQISDKDKTNQPFLT